MITKRKAERNGKETAVAHFEITHISFICRRREIILATDRVEEWHADH